MIQFLYGQDVYRSREEMRKIIEEYRKSYLAGSPRCEAGRQANPNWFDFIRIDAADRGIEVFEQVRQTTNTVSMFGSRKLIIIENIFLIDEELQKSVLEFLEQKNLETNKDIIMVFWSEEVAKQNNLFKFLKARAECQEFIFLKGYQLRSWIKDYIKEQKGKIENSAIEKLIEYVGSDLWRITNEINKLISYKSQIPSTKSQTIKIEDVELLVKPEIDLKIFNLIDAMGYKNKNKALKLMNQYFEKGEDEIRLLGMFVYQFRNLIKVKSSPTAYLGLPLFVVQKAKQQARNFTFEELKKIYHRLLAIDLDIKTGRTDATTGLEVFLAKL